MSTMTLFTLCVVVALLTESLTFGKWRRAERERREEAEWEERIKPFFQAMKES